MKAVCTGDKWLGPDGRVWYVVGFTRSGDVRMKSTCEIFVSHKTLELEDGWRLIGTAK